MSKGQMLGLHFQLRKSDVSCRSLREKGQKRRPCQGTNVKKERKGRKAFMLGRTIEFLENSDEDKRKEKDRNKPN